MVVLPHRDGSFLTPGSPRSDSLTWSGRSDLAGGGVRVLRVDFRSVADRWRFRGAVRRLVLVLSAVVVVAACGPSSEPLSSDAVADKVRGIAGPDGKVYSHDAILRRAGGGADGTLLVVVACPAGGDCTLVGRDGATYPDMQTFVDESDDVAPGDEVFANADPTNPDAKPELALYTKSGGLAWGWYAGGATLLVLLIATGWLAIRRRRRAKP